jgi:nucleoside 2-deoxyribosyltransferase
MRVVEAPNIVDAYWNIKIFLAGSIEMGKAEPWQDVLIKQLEALPMEHNHDIVVFNPRRAEWDASWEQDISNPKFTEQVDWELDNLDRSDIIVFYFDPNTMSPITLMELGYVINLDKNLVVCCPKGFWRRGNVQVLCERYNIPVLDSFDDIVEVVKFFHAEYP